jgi:hypothetical protein
MPPGSYMINEGSVSEALASSLGTSETFCKEGAIALGPLSERTSGAADSIVMNPACWLPKFFEAQPTADSADEKAVWRAPVPRADSSSSQGSCALYRRDPLFSLLPQVN